MTPTHRTQSSWWLSQINPPSTDDGARRHMAPGHSSLHSTVLKSLFFSGPASRLTVEIVLQCYHIQPEVFFQPAEVSHGRHILTQHSCFVLHSQCCVYIQPTMSGDACEGTEYLSKSVLLFAIVYFRILFFLRIWMSGEIYVGSLCPFIETDSSISLIPESKQTHLVSKT